VTSTASSPRPAGAGHAGGEVAGFEDAARGVGDGAEGARCAPREDDADGEGEEESAGSGDREGAAERGEEHGAAVEDAADLKLQAGRPLEGGDGVVAQGVLRNAHGADFLVEREGAEGDGFYLRLDPVGRHRVFESRWSRRA
jgi:hypothetical protein